MTKLTRKKFTKTNLVNIKHHVGERPKKYFAQTVLTYVYLRNLNHQLENLTMHTGAKLKLILMAHKE